MAVIAMAGTVVKAGYSLLLSNPRFLYPEPGHWCIPLPCIVRQDLPKTYHRLSLSKK